MYDQVKYVKIGLALTLAGLLFGILLGIGFGANEDAFKDFIAEGVTAHPQLHDSNSEAKIWRYAQRAHFHATGVAAFSIGLIIMVMFSSLKSLYKKVSSSLIGLGNLYPLAWFTMFLLAPTIGQNGAHEHLLTKIFTYVAVGSLLIGILLLSTNVFLGLFAKKSDT